MKKLSIVGLGLMGGSLGLAARANGVADTVHAYARRKESCDEAVDRGMVDAATDSIQEAVSGADLVVFCVPVLTIPVLVKDCLDNLPEGCVITDVGSTKAEISGEIERMISGMPVSFVGSHPIAGSHMTGLDTARADLYEGAVVVVTTGGAGDEGPVDVVRSLWEQIGGRTVIMDADDHDQMLARTSHTPHLLAAALVESVLSDGEERTPSFRGSGFRDTTRVAMGSAPVWCDIVRTNKKHISSQLRSYGIILEKIMKMIEDDDFEALEGFLARCRDNRSLLDGDQL